MPRKITRRPSRFNPLDLKLKRTAPRASTRASLTRTMSATATRLRSAKQPFWKRLDPRGWKFHFTWKKFFIAAGVLLGVMVISMAAIFAYYVRDLPNPNALIGGDVSQSTKILDRNGELIYSFFGDKNRTLVPLDQINPYLQKATIAVEDDSFYQNSGFAITGILRAVRNRVTGQGLTGGGSTITQQFVKNAIQEVETVDGKPVIKFTNRTLGDKVKELILAIELEQRYTKDEILAGYLNNISYGNNAYGTEQAAQTYFDKSAKDLTLSEAAVLAAIPQLPSYYSPYGTHVDKLMERKELVLNRMAKVGFITQEEADAAKTEAPTLENQSFAARGDLAAPHFIFFVRQALIEYIGGDAKEAEQTLDHAGLTVHTSLDLGAQELAQSVIKGMGESAVTKYKATNAALSAVDPNNGEVLAMVGSIDYKTSKSGNTNFATAALQPGSSFKPFVFATQFDPDHGESPASITYDVKTDFGGGYTPNNYNGNFNGPITNRNALAQSLNIPAVKNLFLAGIDDSIDTAHRMGITTLNDGADKYGLSLVLGSGEVRGVDMANAYGAFANGGTAHKLRPILYIEQGGQVVKDYREEEGTKAIEPEVAYQITSVLSDTNARRPVFGGLANNFVLPDRPAAAKSGTTQNNRDAWTVGYTPQVSVAVWVGNNDPKGEMTKGADGSVVAAPIWKQFMTQYLTGKPVQQFKQPETLVSFTVDRLSGKIPTDQSPPDQRITDLFAPWQIPKEFDDVHQLVKIDKVSGKLATDLTPSEQVEDRYFFVVRSELPSNSNWENPVQDWARANGGGVNPPTEKDDVHTEDNKPTVSITSPANGATVNGQFTISANAGGNHTISRVEFFINNVSIGSATSAPWQISYDTASLPSGSAIIEAKAFNDIGLTRTTQITVKKSDDGASIPGPVTNASAASGSKALNRPVKITWKNPSDASLSSVTIYQSNASGALGTEVKIIPSTSGSTGTAEILITTPGTYYFTLRTANSGGTQNVPGVQISAQVLP